MKAYLHNALVKTKIKEDFLVLTNGTFKLVHNVANNIVTFPDGTTETEESLEGSVVKLLAIVAGTTPYSIFNKDYDKVIDVLLEPYEGYDNGLQAYLDGQVVHLEGTVIRRTISVEIGDTVRLTNIRHIDKYGLYEYSSRTCKIINYKDYYYHLKCGNVIVKCKREDFSIIDGDNLRSFFQLKCKHCNK